MARGTITSARPGNAALAVHLLRSLRPHQWTKNLIVFAGLIFGLADTEHTSTMSDTEAVARAVLAFAVFCVLSGVVYLINDVRDADADRRHPVKSRRPIASGALPERVAVGAAAVLSTAAVATAFLIGRPFGLVAAIYLVLLGLYSATLKHIVILDVLTIAVGFVLRAIGGAVAIDVSFSHWLLLLTLLLALFLALSKRRAELVTLAQDASGHRRILAEYSPYLLDQMISVVTASTLLAYAFYTIDPDTVRKFGTDRLLWTVPFPLYGILRYLYLVHQRSGGGNPSETLLTDRPILGCVALWGAAVILILYGPWR
ncbi:MAG: decaprenyl-phosphate phosphoribosyltransferase [Acidobacteria bacterium]|nr:decaprenyl-phosphate phosphoribosyltransferase [Acidobacteriota bacterium]